MRYSLAGALATSCLWAALAGLATAADTITLKPAIERGNAWTFEQTQENISDNTMTLKDGQAQTVTTKARKHMAGKLEVLATLDGKPTSVRIAFADDCESSFEMTNQPSEKTSWVYAGKSGTLTRQRDGSIIDDFAVKGDAASRAELYTYLEIYESIYYPRQPVGAGEEWAGDGPALARMFQISGPGDHVEMKVKLLALQDVAGRPTAQLEVAIKAMKDSRGLTNLVGSQGNILVDVGTGHAVKVDMKSTTSVSGDQKGADPEGQAVSYHVNTQGKSTTLLISELISPAGGKIPADPSPSTTTQAVAPLRPAGTAAMAFVGKFSDGNLIVELTEAGSKVAGTFTLGGKQYPAVGSAKGAVLDGIFESGSNRFMFTAMLDEQTMILKSGNGKYFLKKTTGNPPVSLNPLTAP